MEMIDLQEDVTGENKKNIYFFIGWKNISKPLGTVGSKKQKRFNIYKVRQYETH